MKIVGIFDRYTAEVFKFLGVETFIINPDSTNLSTEITEKLNEFKKDQKVFSVMISKNISSKVRKEIEDFILSTNRPAIIEVDPMYNVEKYEDYETIIRRIIRETIGIKL